MKELVYKFLKIFMPNGRQVHLNQFDIKLPVKYYRYYEPEYEENSFIYFKNKLNENSTVLDIGAHIGIYTMFFSQILHKKGKVYSFEPTRSTYQVLLDTIRINKSQNVIPINAAISDKDGELVFNLTTSTGVGSNSNSIVKTNNTKYSEIVKSYSIDNFKKINNLKIDCLKIDVEGAEYYALLGAKNTFEEDKPFGILALHPSQLKEMGSTLSDIFDVLIAYNCQLKFENEPIDKAWFIAQNNLFDITFEVF
jgi:FkbM family methyltransferase